MKTKAKVLMRVWHKRLFPIPHTLYAIPLLLFAVALPAFADGTININNPSAGTGWTFADSVVTITANGNYTVTGTTTANRIVINKDVTATITLQNANIHSATASPFALSSDTIAGGKGSQVTLNLIGTNELVTADTDTVSAGLTVEDSARLIIQGSGSLLAAGGGSVALNKGGGASIGGSSEHNGGYITITDGTVTAIGGYLAAGIGGGAAAGGGNITITGGTVTATGGYSSAGIGGGCYGEGGNITITGGTVTATGSREGGAGIGGGHSGSGGNITITGGTITTQGGSHAAGIGGGWNADGGNITISGGAIVAVAFTNTGDPAAIGGGGRAGAGTINITGGTVYASGGTGAGIGGGSSATGGAINITGGTVIADEIGIAAIGQTYESRTATNISGANTIVLSPSINTTSFGQAKVLTGDSVNVSDAISGDTIVKVTLNAALTIPSGSTLIVPTGIVFDVNNKALTNNGIIREYGSLLNKGSLTGIQPVGAIQASWITNIPSQTYTGDSIKPTISVTNGTLTLAHGAHYSVAYTDNINVGTATVIVTDLGDYHTITKTFLIEDNTPPAPVPIPIAAGWIDSIPPQAYTGDSLKPAVVVRDTSNKILTPGTDYTVAYSNNINVGTATVTVTGIGNYTGTVTKTFLIEEGYTPPTDTITPPPTDTITPPPVDTITPPPVDTITPPSTDTALYLTISPAIGWTYNNSVVTITTNGNYTISGSSTNNRVVINKDVTAGVTLRNVSIHSAAGSPFSLSSNSAGGSNVTLILEGINELATTDGKSAGITVEDKATLTIEGSGSLFAQGSGENSASAESGGAGIGSGSAQCAGAIIINSGTVTANGGILAAGIGGGYANATGGSIAINGGKITATGGMYGAGIGDGVYGKGIQNITVTGGEITVMGGAGIGGAGIGGGAFGQPVDTITINGGTLYVSGGDGGAGIGGGQGGASGRITINGGVVVSVNLGGTGDPAGIGGGGLGGDAGTISITGGTVYASGGTGPGIGSGTGTTGGVINITGGTVIADEIGIGAYGSRTATNISGANTIVLSPTINTTFYSGAAVLTGVNVAVFVNTADTIADVTLKGDFTIPGGVITVPEGIIFDVNHKVLTNNGTIIKYGSIIHAEYLRGNQPISGILQADWIAEIPAQTYTGDSITPAVTVRNGSITLILNTDYTVEYSNNTNVGTATVTVTGKGNYTGSVSKTFLIEEPYTPPPPPEPIPIAVGRIESIPAQTYTGSDIEPAVTVKDSSDQTLTPGVDYTVGYTNNVDAGTATVTLTGKGNYTGSATATFIISPKPITDDWLHAIPYQYYTGGRVEPALTVTDSAKILIANTDYTAEYSSNIYIGIAFVTVTGRGNYTGSASKSFTIVAGQISGSWIKDIPNQTYTGDSIRPAVTVNNGVSTLLLNTDYTVEYSNNVNRGTASVTITGIGNYTGSASATFLIIEEAYTPPTPSEPSQITDEWITIPAQTYTGDPIQPVVIVSNGSQTLISGTDYTFTVSGDNVNAGTATVTVTGKGDYTGTASKSFTIQPKPVADSWISIVSAQLTYTGSPYNPAVTVTDNAKTLESGKDYTVGYINNTNAGTATVTITGTGNYTGTASKPFTIYPKQLATNCVQGDISSQNYTGEPIIPVLTVKDGDKTLQSGTDYVTECINNTDAGTAFVTVSGVGNYTGGTSKTFIINPKPVADEWIGNIPDQAYTGSQVKPELTVKDGLKTLESGKDYTLDYFNNTNIGTAIVTLIGVGNYTGTATATFTIIRSGIPIQESWVQRIPDQYYTGNALMPEVSVTGLTRNVDYTVSYYDNIEAGTATVIIVGIGNYTGVVTLSFRIIPTGMEEAAKSILRVVAEDRGIFISGLTPGETFGIYNLQGKLVYEGKATLPEERIPLREKGVYILSHKDKQIKFNY